MAVLQRHLILTLRQISTPVELNVFSIPIVQGFDVPTVQVIVGTVVPTVLAVVFDPIIEFPETIVVPFQVIAIE